MSRHNSKKDYWIPAFAGMTTEVERRQGRLAVGVIQLLQVGEPGEGALEMQPDGAGRAVALLADDDFGLAVQAGHLVLPCRHGFEIGPTRRNT